jgi:hypothetical protein
MVDLSTLLICEMIYSIFNVSIQETKLNYIHDYYYCGAMSSGVVSPPVMMLGKERVLSIINNKVLIIKFKNHYLIL